jgi:choline monooxygenase
VLARTWHWTVDATELAAAGSVSPRLLLPGCLDEPLVFTRDTAGLHCLSNVCTHRANLVANESCTAQSLLCRYHGRRFTLGGRFVSMPEFEGAAGFPTADDDLRAVSFARLGDLLFASLDPHASFEEIFAPVRARLAGVPLEGLTFDPRSAREFPVRAHFALYCDNYLEGFHIPYVHPSLSRGLAYDEYTTELFPFATLQTGIAEDGEDTFPGTRVAAYYVWLWPTTMLNFYPWGLSLNAVQPISIDETRVLFRSYVHDPSRLARGAGSDLDRVENEDEAVVENVQRGVRSRLYRRGRYSPARETGVHHFHRLLAAALA